MIEAIIEICSIIGELLVDFWVDKIVNRFSKKKRQKDEKKTDEG